MVWKDPVFQRAEDGELDACEKRGAHEQPRVGNPEAQGRQRHDGDFAELRPLDEHRLLEPVGELPADGREEDRRKKEQHHDQVDRRRRPPAHVLCQLEGHQHHEGVLENVVVERAEKLDEKEGQESPGSEQRPARSTMAL